MQVQFLAPVELFFKAVERLQFLTRVEFLFFMIYSFPARGLRRLHPCIEEGNIQPFWKVRGLEQYTSWKVRVPKLEKCCVSFYLFSFSVSVSVCCVWVVVVVCVCVCPCFSLCLEQAQ